jgi:NAD(P)-dependent dehydrogenase (short-subunit alcohol dehydrogenase family)
LHSSQAARGIGFGIAETFLVRDHQVVVTGLTNSEMAAVPPRKGLAAIRLDVTNDDSVNNAVAFSQHIDVLVNCAGMILRRGSVYGIDHLQKVMDVNLTGTMRMALVGR